jgi:hypothetical protein
VTESSNASSPIQPWRAPEIPASRTPATRRAAVAPAGKPAEREPVIRVIREGAEVLHIEIECGCGSRIRLDCEYDAPPAGSATKPTETTP